MSCAKHPLTFIITRTRKVNVIYMFQLTRWNIFQGILVVKARTPHRAIFQLFSLTWRSILPSQASLLFDGRKQTIVKITFDAKQGQCGWGEEEEREEGHHAGAWRHETWVTLKLLSEFWIRSKVHWILFPLKNCILLIYLMCGVVYIHAAAVANSLWESVLSHTQISDWMQVLESPEPSCLPWLDF